MAKKPREPPELTEETAGGPIPAEHFDNDPPFREPDTSPGSHYDQIMPKPPKAPTDADKLTDKLNRYGMPAIEVSRDPNDPNLIHVDLRW